MDFSEVFHEQTNQGVLNDLTLYYHIELTLSLG